MVLTSVTLVDVTQLGLLIGGVSPLLTAIVQQPRWSDRTRSIVAIAIAVVLGFGTAAAAGELNGAGLAQAVVTVAIAAQASYHLLKQTGLPGVLERATSPSTGRHAADDDAGVFSGTLVLTVAAGVLLALAVWAVLMRLF